MNDIVVTSFFIFFLSLDFTIIISDARRPQTHKHIHQHSFARSLFRSVLFILHPRKRPHLLQQLLRHLDPTLFILPLTLSLDRVLSLVLFSVVQALDVVLAKLETRRAILRLCHALDSFEKSSSVSQTTRGSGGGHTFASHASGRHPKPFVRSFVRSFDRSFSLLLGLQNRSKIASTRARSLARRPVVPSRASVRSSSSHLTKLPPRRRAPSLASSRAEPGRHDDDARSPVTTREGLPSSSA